MEFPNWFEMGAVQYFDNFLKDFKGKENLEFLQIGAFTGDASKWLMDNIITDKSSYLTDVDTWSGSADEPIHNSFNWDDVEKKYDESVSGYENVKKFKGTSYDFLLSAKDNFYDFIYIDGDHRAESVFKDAVMSWSKLKVGGTMAFDDYTWKAYPDLEWMKPRSAIDKFTEMHFEKIETINIGHQYWIKKKSELTGDN